MSTPISISMDASNNFLFSQQKLKPQDLAPNNGPSCPVVLNKADLRFEGNLEDIIYNWSPIEKAAKRRLVEFWRHHENNTIYCSFKPISPSQKEPNATIISCIYCQEKDQYFVTSVDCITLLETLIAVKFTVEEKNRIRRNLEGFRPLTISKCKPDTSEFFKLIMAFPNPKPRNIEKDVKVFPWKILPYALKKIINKYAAGYTPATGVNSNVFSGSFSNFSSGLTSPATNFQMGFNGNPPMNNFPIRTNMQRRFSQPINSLNMSQFQHPYKPRQHNNISSRMTSNLFQSNGLSMQYGIKEEEEEETTMCSQNMMANPTFNATINPMSFIDTNNISALSLESVPQPQLKTSSLQRRLDTNFDHDFLVPTQVFQPPLRAHSGPRRHSLADPYSLQRFQAMKFGIGPFAMNSTTESSNSPFDFNPNPTTLNSIQEDSNFNMNSNSSFMMNNNNNLGMIENNQNIMMYDDNSTLTYGQDFMNVKDENFNNMSPQHNFQYIPENVELDGYMNQDDNFMMNSMSQL